MSYSSKVIWFWDGSKFKPFIFPFFLQILITGIFTEVALLSTKIQRSFNSRIIFVETNFKLKKSALSHYLYFEAKIKEEMKCLKNLKIRCISWQVSLSPSLTFWAIAPSPTKDENLHDLFPCFNSYWVNFSERLFDLEDNIRFCTARIHKWHISSHKSQFMESSHHRCQYANGIQNCETFIPVKYDWYSKTVGWLDELSSSPHAKGTNQWISFSDY